MTATDLDSFFQKVQVDGKLRTPAHAERWSAAVLRTLGFHLERRAKRKLARELPPMLAADLNRIFWLIHFRDRSLSLADFLNQVARRSGNTDVDFARFPTAAVFGALKALIDEELSQRVADGLPPEIGEFWRQS